MTDGGGGSGALSSGGGCRTAGWVCSGGEGAGAPVSASGGPTATNSGSGSSRPAERRLRAVTEIVIARAIRTTVSSAARIRSPVEGLFRDRLFRAGAFPPAGGTFPLFEPFFTISSISSEKILVKEPYRTSAFTFFGKLV
jgi:hypothetical protein